MVKFPLLHLFLFGCTAFPFCCSLQPKHVPRMWVSHEHSCPITWAFGTPNSCWDKQFDSSDFPTLVGCNKSSKFRVESSIPTVFSMGFLWVFSCVFHCFSASTASTAQLPRWMQTLRRRPLPERWRQMSSSRGSFRDSGPGRAGRGTNQDFRLVTWEFMGVYI